MPNRRTPTPVHGSKAPESAATVPPDDPGARLSVPTPTTPVAAPLAPDTSTHVSVRTQIVQQMPDHRDVPVDAGLPWWRYAFPTSVDLTVAVGLLLLLYRDKLHSDWSQVLAIIVIALLAGVRGADLSSLVRGGQGTPPGTSLAALVGAGITAAAHVLTRSAGGGRATAHQLAGALILFTVIALAAAGALFVYAGGFR